MNREEYLKELSKYLKRLPKKDYDDTMNYFEEYFEEVGIEGEQDLIRELGSPSTAASEILSKLLNENKGKNEGKNKLFNFGENKLLRTFLIAILCILAAPFGIPATIVVISIILSFFMICVSIIFVLFALSLVGIFFLVLSSLIAGLFTIFLLSIPGGMFLLGCGLIILGLNGLLYIAGKYVVSFLINLCKETVSYISRRRGKKYE
ncbi:DUF1700 domain-containing protein [Parvimonas sp. G1604]|uniref:DUF1700 domain-containing protein n=1 Tax=Parvimonas sp. G1604 TaxID=3388845 RepID=UPI003D01882C